MARDLEHAEPDQVVYVSRKGRSLSPRRYVAHQVISYGVMGAGAVATGLLYAALFGTTAGFIGAAAVLVLSMRGVPPYLLCKRGIRAMLDDRLDVARTMFERAQRAPLVPRRTRAQALRQLAAVERAEGNLERSLELLRRADVDNPKPREPFRTMRDTFEVDLLVELGRVEDARSLLSRIPRPPDDADYVRVLWWSAELNVCMAEGAHTLSDEELHTLAVVALRTTTAVALLGLLAWAYHAQGDDDEAWHLLRTAYDRDWGLFRRVFGPLRAWMDAHAEQAGVGREDDLD